MHLHCQNLDEHVCPQINMLCVLSNAFLFTISPLPPITKGCYMLFYFFTFVIIYPVHVKSLKPCFPHYVLPKCLCFVLSFAFPLSFKISLEEYVKLKNSGFILCLRIHKVFKYLILYNKKNGSETSSL